ncbi:MAG TPA: VOC family protein [Planctomycetota bacterium]
MRVNYAIVFVSDMNRSVAFYRDVLGLPLRFESPGWTEFATEGSTLALHASDAAPGGDEAAEHGRPGTCRTGFQVPDLGAYHQRMIEHGVACLQEPQSVFGARVALYADPDGMPISVGEPRRGG